MDDTPHASKLYGKQGYGRFAGIWHTIYLEARRDNSIGFVHFTPDIDNNLVHVRDVMIKPAGEELNFKLDVLDLG